ncbi:MAG TPA: glycosyltransferase family A protein [Steroidobacteraceae bacterium]|nr:glycosyltransferase family A protein [Steroidobacteraceae bacterium]
MKKENRPEPSSHTPRVSIGMPVYNGERWLATTIDSLRRQTFADFELIISDNASEDQSAAICLRHAAEDARIRYLRQPSNIGANRNYLAVLREARGPYFKWASSNDLCAPEFLERCVTLLDRRPDAVLACPRTALFQQVIADAIAYECDVEVEEDDPALRFAGVLQRMRLNNSFNGILRTAALRRALPMGTFWAADVVLMADLALIGKLALLPERHFFRRMSAESATSLRGREAIERHFEPTVRRPLLWQHWKYHLRLLRVALRSAPGVSQKLRAAGFAVRFMVWARNSLAADLLQAMRRLTPARDSH